MLHDSKLTICPNFRCLRAMTLLCACVKHIWRHTSCFKWLCAIHHVHVLWRLLWMWDPVRGSERKAGRKQTKTINIFNFLALSQYCRRFNEQKRIYLHGKCFRLSFGGGSNKLSRNSNIVYCPVCKNDPETQRNTNGYSFILEKTQDILEGSFWHVYLLIYVARKKKHIFYGLGEIVFLNVYLVCKHAKMTNLCHMKHPVRIMKVDMSCCDMSI